MGVKQGTKEPEGEDLGYWASEGGNSTLMSLKSYCQRIGQKVNLKWR